MNTLKLFVWPSFCPNYHDGLAFAIASTEEEAKDLIRAKMQLALPDDVEEEEWEEQLSAPMAYDCWGPVQILPLTEPVAFGVEGGG